ncbi:unnamed protein product (macronuclear) [Paramecium tetraurelia]|uniref:Enoyl reductase (ER) domain-containing protein n=1 Tax=Paramecium tetraurelia TaxID=5888 RepID=A0BH43_PARTE|nr:uncharacterized protein GSPATT00028895001 [Paramecium tetraurelia]CAK57860.1 unnamed protein product [Paramecium tetraurelia]|eukprot:XP_001425258.1 hypothetical protein (macronuclear) [Paramecium tetraurelia strain d4-2]
MHKQSLILQQKAPKNINELDQAFKLIDQKLDAPSSQLLLMKTRYISIDPIMRVWISGAKTYLPALQQNDIIHAFTLSSPVDNQNDIYFGPAGLQTHFLYDKTNKKKQLIKVPRQMLQILQKCELQNSNLLTIILNGLPAYYGLVDFCKIQKGQRVVISAAAGATGLFCIQLAISMQCDVIGFTGDIEKIKFLQNQFPTLRIINYKLDDWDKQIENNSVDCYFDNVGEYMLEKMIEKMRKNGKIALCGSMGSSSNYNERQGLSNMNQIINKRLKLKGITFNQELNKIQAAFDYLFQQFQQKKLRIFQEEYNQLNDTPKALKRLFKGDNIGKIIINLDNQTKL